VREATDNPLNADDHNFYKVEKWTKDGTKVDRMLYAGNNLDKARDIFARAIKHRPVTRQVEVAQPSGRKRGPGRVSGRAWQRGTSRSLRRPSAHRKVLRAAPRRHGTDR
jgi:hypothetical protein